MKKTYSFSILLAAALLFAAAPSCTQPAQPGQGDGEEVIVVPEDDGGHTDPASTSLLTFLKEKAAEYNMDASIPTNRVYICAHRAITFSSTAAQIPENSVPCIEEAIRQGAEFVEIDVRLTSDGVPMIMHDETVNATTNGTGKIADMTFEQVRALRMTPRGSSVTYKKDGVEIQVPTLEEALNACKGKIYVNLDVKACTVNILMKAIKNTGTVNQVMIYGMSPSEKQECVRYAYEKIDQSWLALHPYISSPEDIKKYSTPSYYDCCKLFQYSYETYYNTTVDRFGSKCHAYGALSYSNSLDKDSQIVTWYNTYFKNGRTGSCTVLDRFIASGSDVLQTNYCEYAHEYLKSKGLR